MNPCTRQLQSGEGTWQQRQNLRLQRHLSMVHITDVKKITLMEQVADEYENLGKQGRFSKKCIPRGYIPDFDWTTIHNDQDQPIKTITQDPAEDTTTPAAPTEVEGPPSSCLRSKTKQQQTSNEQGQLNYTFSTLQDFSPTTTGKKRIFHRQRPITTIVAKILKN